VHRLGLPHGPRDDLLNFIFDGGALSTKARPKNASGPTSGQGQAPHWKRWEPAGTVSTRRVRLSQRADDRPRMYLAYTRLDLARICRRIDAAHNRIGRAGNSAQGAAGHGPRPTAPGDGAMRPAHARSGRHLRDGLRRGDHRHRWSHPVELVLTDPSCVHFTGLRRYITDVLLKLPGVDSVEVAISTTILWTPDRQSGPAS
jgi:hypothetical protein